MPTEKDRKEAWIKNEKVTKPIGEKPKLDRSILGTIIVIVILIVVPAFTAYLKTTPLWPSFDSEKEISYDRKTLVQIEKALNKHLPAMLDKEIRMERAVALGNTLVLRVTTVNHSSLTYDTNGIESVFDAQAAHYCTDADYRRLLDNHLSIMIVYHSNDEKLITKNEITLEDCK